MSVECLRKKLLLRVEPEGAGVADASDFQVAWVVGRWNLLGVGPLRGSPAGSGGFVIERLVRTDVVVSPSEAVEDALL